jgi:selenocysteine-specific elongation factor
LLGLPEARCRDLARGLPGIGAAGGRFVATAVTTALREAALAAVTSFHRRNPAERGISLETLRKGLRAPEAVTAAVVEGMAQRGEIRLSNGRAALPGFVPRLGDAEAVLTRALARLELAGLTPPTVAELERELEVTGLLQALRFAAQEKRTVAVEPDRYFSLQALDGFVATLRELAVNEAITPRNLRNKLGLSRKYLIPLLEWADRAGVTRRVGDTRVLA